jgi:pimeloyl-ACP methyl ester carboxylesterase
MQTPRSTRFAARAAVVALTASVATVVAPASADPSFYTPPAQLPAGSNGDIIRHEPMQAFIGLGGLTAKAQRIMYVSRDGRNRRIAVTGAVLTPTLPWTGPGQRPIIGYAAGTQGMGDQCAPSRQLSEGLEYETPNVLPLLLDGYGVVLTDYEGLGTPGTHSYLQVAPEAHAVLDSIRAAQRLPAANLPDNGPVGIAGFSQGGGAAAAAMERQPTYAGELKLKGGYAGGVPADLGALLAKLDGGWASGLGGGYFIKGLDDFYPELHVQDLLNDAGRQVAEQTNDECVPETGLRHRFLRHETLTKDGRSLAENLAEQPYKAVMDQQLLGNRKPTAPVLVMQSPTDELVPYEPARQMARNWCKQGANVLFLNLLAPEHGLALLEGATRVRPWFRDRFTGEPQAGNCGGI